MALDMNDSCIAAIRQGVAELQRGDLGSAEAFFRAADKLARAMPPDSSRDLSLLAQCHISLLHHRKGQSEIAKTLQSSAMTALDECATQIDTAIFDDLMADVLIKLHEYRGAIPFCERAILRESETSDPTAIAGRLARAGQCYGLMGLMDHSAVSTRAALKVLRNYPGDPRLPGVLVALGNALRKSSPPEAESLYREAASFYVAKAHIESATTAWVNLGILCSEQGRYAESLEHYERALRVRAQFHATPHARIGVLLNNIANSHRTMGNFEKAHKLLDRAIELLNKDKLDGAPALAFAYGTRGLIFKDAGRDAEAVRWFQRSYAQRMNISSPNFEAIVENLVDEIAALKRLGRLDQAALAEDRLAAINAARNKVPKVNRDLSSLISQAKGSVLVEIGVGSRTANRVGNQDAARLAARLASAIEGQNAGFSGGNVTIPESTTLIFYGEDAEELFRAIEPILVSERICEGASITIRQGTKVREAMLPGTVN